MLMKIPVFIVLSSWLRTVRSGDWCLRSAKRTLSGACQKWRWWWFHRGSHCKSTL